MDLFLADINFMVFKMWVLYTPIEDVEIKLNKMNDSIVEFDKDSAHGEIRFNGMNIIEMEVKDEDETIVFYLHFQMQTIGHAKSLYTEFVESLKSVEKKQKIDVLLSCSSGLTTGFFASQLDDAAQTLGIDYHFNAVAFPLLYDEGTKYDVIVLAPQIAFKKAEVQSVFSDKIVMELPGKIFASYDVKSTLDMVADAVSQKEEENSPKEAKKDNGFEVQIKRDVKIPTKMMNIGVIRHLDQVRILYRICDHDVILVDEQIVKRHFNFNDLKDVIDTNLAVHKDIKIVSFAVPRTIDGLTLLPLEEADNKLFLEYLKNTYTQQFIWTSDVNAVAVGYYITQDEFESFSLLFQPRGTTQCSVGSIVNGQLIVGRKGMAGELQFVNRLLSDEEEVLARTPEGVTELVAQAMIPVISVLAPEAIFVHSEMIPDTEGLMKHLTFTMPKQYIPEVIKLEHFGYYIQFGQMVLCSEAYNKENGK